MPAWGWNGNKEVPAQGYKEGEVTCPGGEGIRSIHVVGDIAVGLSSQRGGGGFSPSALGCATGMDRWAIYRWI